MRAIFANLEKVASTRVVVFGALVLGALLSSPVMAAAAVQGEAKLPQLDIQTYPSQIFWLIVSFVVLYFLVSKFAVPRISDVLEERQERITDDLDKAETLKKESEQVRLEYEKALADARDKAHAATREAQDLVTKSGAEAEAEAQGKVVAILKDAEARIAAARTEAIVSVRSVARDVAGDAVTKLIGVRVGADEIDRVIYEAMEGRG